MNKNIQHSCLRNRAARCNLVTTLNCIVPFRSHCCQYDNFFIASRFLFYCGKKQPNLQHFQRKTEMQFDFLLLSRTKSRKKKKDNFNIIRVKIYCLFTHLTEKLIRSFSNISSLVSCHAFNIIKSFAFNIKNIKTLIMVYNQVDSSLLFQ